MREATRGALAALIAGNRRFVSGRTCHPHQSSGRVRAVAARQAPFAVVLGCADSRVAPELLFDQGVGDIFANRVAGNIVDDLLLGSIEYAVEQFAPPVVLVLGHERCGAVAAAMNAVRTGTAVHGHVSDIVEALRPIVTPCAEVGPAVRANIRAQAAALPERSEIIRRRVERGETAVVSACYDLDTGSVTLLG